eukprot:3706068-Ditylum_brightwellii.AAC.1
MAHAQHTMHIINQLGRYGMILVRDILQELGVANITWDNYQADMKSADIMLAEHIANVEATRT